MPCMTDTTAEDRAALNNVTRMLCALCERSETTTIHAVPGLTSWWNLHQANDEKRRKRELRERALSKLTQEEKEALGL